MWDVNSIQNLSPIPCVPIPCLGILLPVPRNITKGLNKGMSDLFTSSKEKIFFIAGPCVLESLELALKVGVELARIREKLGVTIVFKSSFDKANRTSLDSFRGPGLETGLKWLEKIKKETGLPLLTDYHTPEQAEVVAEVVDVYRCLPFFADRQIYFWLEPGLAKF